MATYQNQTFNNQSVDIDGNRYEACRFTNCRLVYKGGNLPQFVRCTFSGSDIQLEDAAQATVKYLEGLHRGGLVGPVDTVLNDIQRGTLALANRPQPCPPVNTGDNYNQLAVYASVFVLITVIILGAYWYSYVTYPLNILNGDVTQPLIEEISLDVMPALPDELALAYDAIRAEQLTRIVSYEWVNEETGTASIPVSDAMTLLLQQGLPVRDAANNAQTDNAATDDETNGETPSGDDDTTGSQ